MEDNPDYTTIQAGHWGFLAVIMVWEAHQDSYKMQVIDGPMRKTAAASVAVAAAQRLGIEYRRGRV